jgi:hypothetical protein
MENQQRIIWWVHESSPSVQYGPRVKSKCKIRICSNLDQILDSKYDSSSPTVQVSNTLHHSIGFLFIVMMSYNLQVLLLNYKIMVFNIVHLNKYFLLCCYPVALDVILHCLENIVFHYWIWLWIYASHLCLCQGFGSCRQLENYFKPCGYMYSPKDKILAAEILNIALLFLKIYLNIAWYNLSGIWRGAS